MMVAAPHAHIWLINAVENTKMSFRAFRTMKSSSRPQKHNFIQHIILERFGTDVYRNSKILTLGEWYPRCDETLV